MSYISRLNSLTWDRNLRDGLARFLLATTVALPLAGCGTTVPTMAEFWESNSSVGTQDLEYKIKQKVYCELQTAVARLNNASLRQPVKQEFHGKTMLISPLPQTWGVQMTLQLVVEENSSLNPDLTYTDPLHPGRSMGVAVPRTFTLGAAGTLSADAMRTDKFTFYYLVPDLQGDQPACYPENIPQSQKHGSSLLLESDLGIYSWLNNTMNLRAEIGNSRTQQEVVSYDVKFDIVSSGSITPAWKLVTVATGAGGAGLFSAKRERTHELILTFGPSQPDPNGKSQPSALAFNEAFAQQIGAAVGNAIKGVVVP